MVKLQNSSNISLCLKYTFICSIIQNVFYTLLNKSTFFTSIELHSKKKKVYENAYKSECYLFYLL